jgi:hypothetical protein
MASAQEEGARSHMMQINGRDGAEVNERTSLLGTNRGLNHGSITPNEADEDVYGRDIDPNEFDLILSRSESYASGLGIEPQSQENSMLRGPRRYSNVRPGRKPSFASLQRRASRSTIGSDQSPIEEIDEIDEDGEEESKSPFLAGVSVVKFWLIFTGSYSRLRLLINSRFHEWRDFYVLLLH